ncbi:outer membrane protein assembly factor BamB family protein [Jatrophihabitans endophyticus]|uniref:outer membrane protein assembly factor BamB family protein n=1 Tax=Jatrophihabitans endophyticus TaxID=1206085 RepID=UPI00135639A8|nr:PQQ-binding-like beta-propeller repeat protein [Jatrophihabitans endophyticus]
MSERSGTGGRAGVTRTVSFGFGVGLLLAGTVVLVVGGWGVADDLVSPSPGRGSAQALIVLTWLAIAALLGCVVLAHRGVAGSRRWLAPTVLLVVCTTLTALLALGAAVVGALGLRSQHDLGFPGAQTLLVAVGGLATGIGALLLFAGFPPRLGRPRPFAVVGGAVGVALVAATSVPLSSSASGWTVDATTAASTTAPAAPSAVARQAWAFTVHGQVQEVVAAGTGVAVLTARGVTAVDGRTGKERWHYERSGAQAVRLAATPDRTVVLVGFDLGGGVQRLFGLDAVSGRVRFALRTKGNDGLLGPSRLQVTDTTLLGSNGAQGSDDEGYEARSLRTGRRSWTYRAPSGCVLHQGLNSARALPAGLVVFLLCGAGEGPANATVQLLDGATGHVRWHHTTRLPSRLDLVTTVSSGGDLVYAAYVEGAHSRSVLLDTATGAVVRGFAVDSTTAPIVAHDATTGAGRGLRDIRTRRVLLPPGPPANCASAELGAVLARSVVCAERAPTAGADEKGIVQVRTADYGSARFQHTITVRLGGPFPKRTSVTEPARLVAAPGAVVLADTASVGANGTSVVVGLR